MSTRCTLFANKRKSGGGHFGRISPSCRGHWACRPTCPNNKIMRGPSPTAGWTYQPPGTSFDHAIEPPPHHLCARLNLANVADKVMAVCLAAMSGAHGCPGHLPYLASIRLRTYSFFGVCRSLTKRDTKFKSYTKLKEKQKSCLTAEINICLSETSEIKFSFQK